MNNSEIKLNLIDNSHGYINEAVDYAIKAKKDTRKWQFAILNLVQGLELSLKSLLFKIHPAFIFDNLDKINKNIKTVAPLQAFERLKNPAIGNILFAKNDKIKLEKAISLRNQMIHSEFNFYPEFATIKFLDVFAFLVHFQAVYLKTEIETIISKESLEEILTMKKSIKVLLEKAKQRIKKENIKPENVWVCPECENETFVIDSDVSICYTCRCEEEIFECEKCREFFLNGN